MKSRRLICMLSVMFGSLSLGADATSVPASQPGASSPGAPLAAMQHFSSRPLIPVPAPVTGTRSLVTSRALAPRATVSPSVVMKILVVDGTTDEISYQSITTFLDQIGVPYSAVVLSAITPDASGNRLSGLALSNPSTGQGLFQGIILTDSSFGVCDPTCHSLLSAADWSKLDTYASQFSARVVSYFTWPEARWGLVPADSGASYTPANPLYVNLTAAGASVFSVFEQRQSHSGGGQQLRRDLGLSRYPNGCS